MTPAQELTGTIVCTAAVLVATALQLFELVTW